MSKRNSWKVEEDKQNKAKGLLGPFTEALKQVDSLEERAIYSLVPIQFTVEDILTEVLEPEHMKLLRAVSTLAKDTYTNQHIALKPFNARVTVDLESYGIYPFKEETCMNISSSCSIATALTGIFDLMHQYDKVREVVKWLNKNATIGAARYYWPSMCALLSTEHNVHSADGTKFKEIQGVGGMINKFRETSGIVASSLLLPEVETKRTKVILTYGEENHTVGII